MLERVERNICPVTLRIPAIRIAFTKLRESCAQLQNERYTLRSVTGKATFSANTLPATGDSGHSLVENVHRFTPFFRSHPGPFGDFLACSSTANAKPGDLVNYADLDAGGFQDGSPVKLKMLRSRVKRSARLEIRSPLPVVLRQSHRPCSRRSDCAQVGKSATWSTKQGKLRALSRQIRRQDRKE